MRERITTPERPARGNAPPGASVLIPRLVCRDPVAAIDFCATTFGAVERVRRPGPDGMVAHADQLEDCDTSKGTVRFPAGTPLPASLVRKLVQARLAGRAARRASRGAGRAR